MSWNTIIIGAGAAGLFCASIAAQRGRRVLLIDHAKTLGEKIRISGGGRCNFTNRESTSEHFLSLNSGFAAPALSRYRPQDFIALLREHRIGFHEKHRGQLFCDNSSRDIITMLLSECAKGGAVIRHPVSVTEISTSGLQWRVATSQGEEFADAVVLATGGLAVPAIGATGFALDFARRLDIPVVTPRAALVPLSFTSADFADFADLAGVSLQVSIAAGISNLGYGDCTFHEDLLITHKGLSGPAVLQASSYWEEGDPISIDWTGGADVSAFIDSEIAGAKTTDAVLAALLPGRLAKLFSGRVGLNSRKWAEIAKKDRRRMMNALTQWQIKPAGTLGWKKAEVMRGGIDTRALDRNTMMVCAHPGLYFIGECVDVTGHLGGHNFQWAWASGYACALAISGG